MWVVGSIVIGLYSLDMWSVLCAGSVIGSVVSVVCSHMWVVGSKIVI